MATQEKAAGLEGMTPEEQVRAVGRTCRGPLKHPGVRAQINALLSAGKLDEARALDGRSRKGCGYDVNNLIVKHAFDGEEHTEPCPNCETEIAFRAPTFD